MRPIDKINFSDGTDSTKPGIELTVKVPGFMPTTAFALEQKATATFVVEVDGDRFHVRLVNKTDPATLLDGEAFLLAGTNQSGLFPVTKITDNRMVVATTEEQTPGAVNQVASFTWRSRPLSEGTRIDVDIPQEQLDVLPVPRVLPIVESPAVYTTDDGIDPLFLDGNNLYAGTGIPGTTQYAVAKTNFIEIAMAPHLRGGPWGTAIVSGTDYTIPYSDPSHDFNVAFSIASIHPDCQRNRLTDMYDIWFVTYMDASGARDDSTAIFWHLEFNEQETRYELFPHIGGEMGTRLNFPIVDNEGPICETNGDETVIQNSFRRFWYKDAIVPPVSPSAIRIEGSFVTRMYARNTITDEMVIDFEVTSTTQIV